MAKTKTLTQSIYRAFERILTIYSDEKSLKGEQADLMMDLSQELADGFKDWLLKQPFRIQKMKAILEVEDFQTTGPRFADVMPTVQTTVPPGVMLPKLTLKKAGGQGGILKSKGYAYIGNNPVGETNERKTEVRLMKQDVKDL